MEIRRAEHADVGWISGQLRDFASSLGTKYSYIPPDDESLESVVQDMVDNHVVLVAWTRGERVGLIGGVATPHPFNPSISCLIERFWWVPPSFRGRVRAGYLLLRDFMKIGERYHTTVVSLERDSNVSDTTMQKFGLKMYEKTYSREI
jgi:hypothetical protein